MSVVVARPRVAVIVEKSTAFGRGLFLGIGRFLRGGGERWDARMWTRHDQAPPWDEAFDGAVGYINAPPLVDWVREHAAAAVSGSASQRTLPMPRVLNDDVAIGRLAAEHLLGRGHRNLLYAGLSHRQYSRDRLAGFQAAVRRAGVRAEACSDQAADIAAALAGATPPLGVMAAGDRAAAMVLDACLGLGLSVPEGVAIVGVDDDEMLCETAAVPLSSVRPDAERVGYEAAALLDRLMAGEPRQTRPARSASRPWASLPAAPPLTSPSTTPWSHGLCSGSSFTPENASACRKWRRRSASPAARWSGGSGNASTKPPTPPSSTPASVTPKHCWSTPTGPCSRSPTPQASAAPKCSAPPSAGTSVTRLPPIAGITVPTPIHPDAATAQSSATCHGTIFFLS